ncbi:MAG TPA: PIN domain-containing protein [Thermoanaerobaculia bacterium]|nr:PIN domain-containing protein [Thermoanaerobaculia bacterium]
MLCSADTNAFIRAFDGLRDDRLTLLRTALRANEVRLSPVVVTELLSAPAPTSDARSFVASIPRLTLRDGYWERAGRLRAELLARRLRARLADCLIAQSCIDHDIPLITYDRDFRHFEPAGLKLL